MWYHIHIHILFVKLTMTSVYSHYATLENTTWTILSTQAPHENEIRQPCAVSWWLEIHVSISTRSLDTVFWQTYVWQWPLIAIIRQGDLPRAGYPMYKNKWLNLQSHCLDCVVTGLSRVNDMTGWWLAGALVERNIFLTLTMATVMTKTHTIQN